MSIASEFESDLTHRVRLSVEHNDGEPYAAWSTGERLAVALVLYRWEYLSSENETESTVLSRIAGDIAGDTDDADDLIKRVRRDLGIRPPARGRFPRADPGMTGAENLPTYDEMRNRAASLLSDALAELRSDWRPGNGPIGAEGLGRVRAVRAIADAKVLLRGDEPERREEEPEPPAKLAPVMEDRAQSWHSPDRTRDTAQTLAEAVRVLNYATGNYSGEGVVYPSTLYDVLGALAGGAGNLDQFARQAAEWLREQAAAGRLAAKYGRHEGHPDHAVADADASLTRVRGAAAALAEALNQAQQDIAELSSEPV